MMMVCHGMACDEYLFLLRGYDNLFGVSLGLILYV
jgi:hypothetical protein